MTFFQKLKNFYRKQQFDPDFLGLFLNPFFFSRKDIYKKLTNITSYLAQNNKKIHKLLDVGCGQKPYQSLFPTAEYIGLEIDTPENRVKKKADVFYCGTHFPFVDKSFDCVLSNQVAEHVQDIDLFFREIYRVLDKEGFLILSLPFIWDEHEIPYDYRRWTSFGISQDLEKYDFSIIQLHKCNNQFSLLFQLTNAYLYKILYTKNKWINFILHGTLFASINILGLFADIILPKNNDMFLDLVILAQKREK